MNLFEVVGVVGAVLLCGAVGTFVLCVLTLRRNRR